MISTYKFKYNNFIKMDFHIELLHLKQELLKEIKKVDKKFTDLHKQESENLTPDILTPLDKINIMLKKTEQMFQAITEQQFKIDKITELEVFKNRINDTVISHDIRLKSLSKDMEDITFKYDREISQNLTLPGFIGPSCRFKSMSEYLLFSIDDLTKLKMEKELMKKEEKDLKSKLDSTVKSVLNLVDNSVKRSNLYTDNKQKNLEDTLDNKYKEFNEKIMEMKALNLSNEKFIKEQLAQVTNLVNELNFIKDNVEQVLDKKLKEIKSNINEIKNKTDKINNEVKKNNKNLDNINNIFKNSGISINNGEKSKFNSNKRLSIVKKPDNNSNIRKNSLKKGNQEEKNYINENIFSKMQKNSSLFKQKPNNELNNYVNQKTVEKNNSNEYFQNFDNKKQVTLNKLNENFQKSENKKEVNVNKLSQIIQKTEYIKESNIINRNENIGKFENKKESSINHSNEHTENFEKKIEVNNIEKTKNKINQNNIKAYNELQYKLKPKYINKNENKIISNSNDKLDSYSIEVRLPTERKTMNLENNSNREINAEKIKHINDTINLSDGESKKKSLKIIKNKRNVIEKKINKYKIIKIDKNKSIENNKNDNKNQTIEKNIINYTDYNFYRKKDLNAFHVYKDEIHNLKRYPFHKIFKNENSEENGQKANSDNNLDINLNNNSSPKLRNSQKINNIYYPNKEQIKNLKHKDFLVKQFLIRHNTIPYPKSEPKNQKIYLKEENNKMYETANNFFNNYHEFKNRSNIFDKINILPPPLIKDNEYSLNKKDVETQSIINIRNNKKPEKFNLKFISLENQFKLTLHQKNLQFRNNPELLLSTPMTKVFKTFQMKKSKDMMINNIINNKNS